MKKKELLKRAVYYISDLHLERKKEKGVPKYTGNRYIDYVVGSIGHDELPLLIAGDISDNFEDVEYFFNQLSQLNILNDRKIIYVLGDSEISRFDDKADFSTALEKYREICKKHNIILLHNEMLFLYDVATKNYKGEVNGILRFRQCKILSGNELHSISSEQIREYAKDAKLIVYGGLGKNENDSEEQKRCEENYLKLSESPIDSPVTVLTHYPFKQWCSLKPNDKFIYVHGHTHQNVTESNIFADNQIGYQSDDYCLKCFYLDIVDALEICGNPKGDIERFVPYS